MRKVAPLDFNIPPCLGESVRLNESGNHMDAMFLADNFLDENPLHPGALLLVTRILLDSNCLIQAHEVYMRLLNAVRLQQDASMPMPREIQDIEKDIQIYNPRTPIAPQYGVNARFKEKALTYSAPDLSPNI